MPSGSSLGFSCDIVELHFARSRIQLAGVACLLAPLQGALDDLVFHALLEDLGRLEGKVRRVEALSEAQGSTEADVAAALQAEQDQLQAEMDADAADATIFGPRRLTVQECERALRQSGPTAPVPLLDEWELRDGE